MVKQLTSVAGAAFALAMVSFPAFAVSPINVPEPSSLALFSGGGAAGAVIYAVNRWIRRK